MLAGSASLIGDHGMAIAWAPDTAGRFGIDNAMEIGIACATFGLILASLIGGPLARILIDRNNLKADEDAVSLVGIAYDTDGGRTVNHISIMAALLALNIAIIIGYLINAELEEHEFKLPLFVTCLLVAILMSNAVTYLLPQMPWPTRTRALALISDYSLNIFLTMSLMACRSGRWPVWPAPCSVLWFCRPSRSCSSFCSFSSAVWAATMKRPCSVRASAVLSWARRRLPWPT